MPKIANVFQKRQTMIQRIQTIYLFLATALMISIIFFPIMENQNGQILEAFYYKYVENANVIKKTVFPLGLTAILAAFLDFIAIFFYKNNKQRVIQVRITTLAMLLSLGFYLGVIFYAYVGDFFNSKNTYSWVLIFPLIAAILNFLAIKAIKKDIEKVKSADRLR